MTRLPILCLALLAACSGAAEKATAPANTTAEIDALARNLAAQADAWRDDVDNQEAAAAADAQAADAASMLQNDATPVANRR